MHPGGYELFGDVEVSEKLGVFPKHVPDFLGEFSVFSMYSIVCIVCIVYLVCIA